MYMKRLVKTTVNWDTHIVFVIQCVRETWYPCNRATRQLPVSMKHVALEFWSLKAEGPEDGELKLWPLWLLPWTTNARQPNLIEFGPEVSGILKTLKFDLDPSALDLWLCVVFSLLKPNTSTKFGWGQSRGLGDIENLKYGLDPSNLDPIGSLHGSSLAHLQSLVRFAWGVLQIMKFYDMTLTPITFTFDTMVSVLVPSIMHISSLNGVWMGFEWDLWDIEDFSVWPWPPWRDLWPMESLLGQRLMHNPSLDEIGLGAFDILKTF